MGSDVELINVTKSFDGVIAVNNISVKIEGGSFFSLLGPSGCGKSTTLRMASGFEVPDSGEIRIAGRDMSRVPAFRRPTNMVFQRWALFPHMTVFENTAFGLKVERLKRPVIAQRVAEALELVGLGSYAKRKPGQLSGGQMQRVALARAIVKRPEVLLLDEPLGALDLKLRLQMQLELKRIQREIGTTFIYVTHDQNEAMTMSDEIAVMNEGRIEQIGSPQDIYDRPATRFVAGFIGHTNLLPVQLEKTGRKAILHAEGVSFQAAETDSVPSGIAHASIRYERIRVGNGAETMVNHFDARVKEVIFSGSAVQYVLTLGESSRELIAETPYDGLKPLYPVGADVTIGWSPEAVRLFPENQHAATEVAA